MKMIKGILFLSLLLHNQGSAFCQSRKDDVCKNKLVLVEVPSLRTIEDSVFSLKFHIWNVGKDTIIFPRSYATKNIRFFDTSVFELETTTTRLFYPKTDFAKKSRSKKKFIAANLCRPYLNDNYDLIPPNAFVQVEFDLDIRKIAGLMPGKSYSLLFFLYVSQEIKLACSSIWSGDLNSISNIRF